MGTHTEAVGALLCHISARALNQIAERGDFEAPVDGDDLAFMRHDAAVLSA